MIGNRKEKNYHHWSFTSRLHSTQDFATFAVTLLALPPRRTALRATPALFLPPPAPIPLLDTVPPRSEACMPSESTQDTDKAFRSREDMRQREANYTAIRRRSRSPRRSRSMSPKTTATPLSTASGNSRTRGAGKKSQKVRENAAQNKAGFSDTDGFSVLEDSQN